MTKWIVEFDNQRTDTVEAQDISSGFGGDEYHFTSNLEQEVRSTGIERYGFLRLRARAVEHKTSVFVTEPIAVYRKEGIRSIRRLGKEANDGGSN